MKKGHIIIVVVVAAIASVLAAYLFSGDACAVVQHMKKKGASTAPASTESAAAMAKLDLRLRQAYDDAKAKGDMSRKLECIMKAKGKITEGMRAQLAGIGFASRSVVGPIATGSMQAKDVPAVAGVEFVESIEYAVPLSIKPR